MALIGCPTHYLSLIDSYRSVRQINIQALELRTRFRVSKYHHPSVLVFGNAWVGEGP